jgi:hypothetical protein
MSDIINKRIVRFQYDGKNSEEALELINEHLPPLTGNEWSIYEEDKDGLQLAEMTDGNLAPYQKVPKGGWLIIHVTEGRMEGLTPEVSAQKFVTLKDGLLETLADPDVIAALRAAVK